jgi:hypothetical protein
MSYRAVGASESPDEKLDLIIKNQEEQARKRKLTVSLAVLGAIIAAGKLGILAVPLIRASRARKS